MNAGEGRPLPLVASNAAPPVYRPHQWPGALQAQQAGVKAAPKSSPRTTPNGVACTANGAAKEPPKRVVQAKAAWAGVNVRDVRPDQMNHNVSRRTHVPPKAAPHRHLGVLQLMENSPGENKGGPPGEDKGRLPGSGNDDNNNSNQESKPSFFQMIRTLPKEVTESSKFISKAQVSSEYGPCTNKINLLLKALSKANVAPSGKVFHGANLNPENPEQAAVLKQIETAFENLCDYVTELMGEAEEYFDALVELGFFAKLIENYKNRFTKCNVQSASELSKLLEKLKCTKPSAKK